MKTIEEIKNEVAKNSIQGFDNWEHFIRCWELYPEYQHLLEELVTEAMQEHAKQCCDEQIRECCNNACVKQESEYIDSLTGYAIVSRIDEESILNTPNVVTTK